MAQTFAIKLSDQTQNVMVSDYVHGERLHIRVTNAPKPLVIGLAGQPGGTGQGADATFSKVGTAVSGEADAYDFVLGHRDIDGVVGEGQAFYFNLWEFDPDDASQEGKVRAVGKVPVGLSIYVPRSAIFPEGEDITATAWPMLSAATPIESITPLAKSGGVDNAFPTKNCSPSAITIVSVQVPPTSVATIYFDWPSLSVIVNNPAVLPVPLLPRPRIAQSHIAPG